MGPLTELFRALNEHGVQYVLVGGVALELHGSGYVTQDVDLVYERSPENVRRLVSALAPFKPRYRVQGVAGGLPIPWHDRTILNGNNFTLTTTLGDLDLFAILPRGWRYANLMEGLARRYDVEGVAVDMLTLEGLWETKHASHRDKDRLVLPEIEAMIEAHKVAEGEQPQPDDGRPR